MHGIIIQNTVVNIQWHDILIKQVLWDCATNMSIAWNPWFLRISSIDNSLESLIFFVPSFLSPNDPYGRQISRDKKIIPYEKIIWSRLWDWFDKPYLSNEVGAYKKWVSTKFSSKLHLWWYNLISPNPICYSWVVFRLRWMREAVAVLIEFYMYVHHWE